MNSAPSCGRSPSPRKYRCQPGPDRKLHHGSAAHEHQAPLLPAVEAGQALRRRQRFQPLPPCRERL